MIRASYTIAAVVLLVCTLFAGCRSKNVYGVPVSGTGNSSVVLAMTDTPPSNVSILAATVTLTGATLIPGNVAIFSGSTTLELTRLQTDTAYIATASNVAAGNYTGLMLTFANPLLTIENDGTSPIVSGTTTCAIGKLCTIAPTTVANLSTTVSLSGFTVAANSSNGLLIDLNLDNLLNNLPNSPMAADFKAGTSVTSFTPAGTGAPIVGAEDVLGQAMSVNASAGTFTLQNAAGSYSLKVDNASNFFQFPSCANPGISCLQNGQILAVDMGIDADGSLLARNIVFEDSDSSEAEVEGMVISTNLSSQQFTMVALTESAAVTGLNIGNMATVRYSTSPQTPFDVDFVHADNLSLADVLVPYQFGSSAALMPGQQVMIRRNGSSSGITLVADRVRLRSSRITGTVQSAGNPNIYLTDLPSFFLGHSNTTQIQVVTSQNTIFAEGTASITFSLIPTSGVISVRGPLFDVSSAPALVATKVVLKAAP